MEITKEQIIAESIKRGFIEGAYIDNSNFYGSSGKITIRRDKDYEYSKWAGENNYYLRVGGDKVYSKGEWAKIITHSKNYKPQQENILNNLVIW